MKRNPSNRKVKSQKKVCKLNKISKKKIILTFKRIGQNWSVQLSDTDNWASTPIGISGAKFKKYIATGPIYPCVICNRLLFFSSVRAFYTSKFSSHPYFPEIERNCSNENAIVDGKLWICFACSRALKNNKLPLLATFNGLKLDPIPPELKGLRPLEERIISLRIPFIKLVSLPAGGQKGIHGNAVNIPSNLEAITTVLPHIPKSVKVIPLKLKKKLSYDGWYMYSFVLIP